MSAFSIAEGLAALKKDYQVKGQALFDEFVQAVFAEVPELEEIRVIGYTPGFNDGDPCVHSQVVMITPADFQDYGFYEDPEDGTPPNQKVDQARALAIATAFDSFEDALTVIHETNFQITFKRTADGVETTVDEYSCGY